MSFRLVALIFGLAIVGSTSLRAQSPPGNDWTVVPGVRVGPMTANTTRGSLRSLFPPGAVEDDEIELDEGMVQPATFVFKNNRSESLAISWDGKGPQAHPKQIFLCYGRRRGTCRWQTESGIRVGTRLSELAEMNGRAFTIWGFGWNYGGNVISWNGGKLETLDCNGKVVLTLDGERSGPGEYALNLTSAEVHSFSGDRPVASTTPALQKLNPAVVEIVVQFGGPDGGKCQAP